MGLASPNSFACSLFFAESNVHRVYTLEFVDKSHLFYHLLNIKYTDHNDSLMVWAAMTFAFFGFLRIGELTCDFNFDPKGHLTIADLTFMPQSSSKYMLVRLKVSKRDPFRKGQTIVTGRTNSNLCPISAMLAYLNSRTPFPNTGPLFSYDSGSFLIGINSQKKQGFYLLRRARL